MPATRLALHRAASGAVALAIAAGGLLVVAPSAQAGTPKPPTGLTPTGSAATSTPTFSWKASPGADRYEIQADNSGDFGSPEFSSSTVNTKAVPTTNLPTGTINWRVRVVNKAGTKGAWATAKVTVSTFAPPAPLTPANGASLAQPTDPPLLTWTAVPGATGYDVEIDRDGNWIGQSTASTPTTSYLVRDPQEIGSWFWRVRAVRGNGMVTNWSSPQSYTILPLADVQADPSMNSGTPVTDVALDWQPVAGAVRYQLQIATDPDFNPPLKDDREVVSTRFSPPTTYLNDQYYWRVRGIDASGNKMAWPATPYQFQRKWSNTPTLLNPVNATTVGDPFYFQWTPVRWATNYILNVGTDPSFSPGTYSTCSSSATTFVPPPGSGCSVPIANARYWRVQAVDAPAGVLGIFSPIYTIDYNPGVVTQISPVSGASVQVPTLTWAAARDAERYRVRIVNVATAAVVDQVETLALSWTPAGILPPANYRWTVQAIDRDATTSVLTNGAAFTVTGPPAPVGSTPNTTTPNTTKSTRFPSLTWQPVTGADHYEIFIKRDFQSAYEFTGSYLTDTTFHYPAATDIAESHLATGVWNWLVVAYDASNVPLSQSTADGIFEITDLAAVGGWSVAMDGNANRDGQGCTLNIIADVSNQCSGVPSTPVLSWAPVPGASFYYVYLANDRELTNNVYQPLSQLTQTTMWVPPTQLPDNTAGTSYYWYVRPCKTPTKCNPDPVAVNASATNAFRKISPVVQLVGPANASVQSDDVRFDWTDYYATNQGVAYLSGSAPSYQTARSYHLQVSASPLFTNNVVDATVDQTTFTSYDSTLPEGALYWRVQASDGDGNGLQWSQTWTLTKRSGEVALTAPAYNATVSGSTPFRWAPKAFASAYRVEVYSNDDGAFSPANRVVQTVTREPALSLTEFLKPSSTAYRWRVQAIDASGRDTAWSATGRFFVSTGTITTTAPTGSGYLKPKTLYFAWNPVTLASAYQLEVRTSAQATALSVTTSASAFAPTDGLSDGTYEWRVTARDPNDGSLGQSAWKPFKIDQTVPTIAKFKAKALNKGTKFTLSATFTERVKGVSTKTVKLYKKGKKTAIKAQVHLSKGKVLTLSNKHKVKLHVGDVYFVKLASGIHDQAGNRLTKSVIEITVIAKRVLKADQRVPGQ